MLSCSHYSTMICSFGYSCCIDENNRVWSFGENLKGRMGQKEIDKIYFPPKRISKLYNINMIACGYYHMIALDYNGKVYSIGSNSYGQLGVNKSNSDLSESVKPREIKVPCIKKISCGGYFNIMLSNDNIMYGFGKNDEGQVGIGTNEHVNKPTQISTCLDIDFIECGAGFSICKDINNNYYSWGEGDQGQLGNGENIAQNKPVLCNNFPDNIRSIKCGIYNTILLTEDGFVYSFGGNLNGQLGLGNNIDSTSNPTLIKGLPEIKLIETGFYHVICIDVSDNIWVFGSNGYGQLGLGNKIDVFKPILNTNISNVLDISHGGFHVLIKKIDNSIMGMGSNSNSQIGLITEDSFELLPINVLNDHDDIWYSKVKLSRQKSARK